MFKKIPSVRSIPHDKFAIYGDTQPVQVVPNQKQALIAYLKKLPPQTLLAVEATNTYHRLRVELAYQAHMTVRELTMYNKLQTSGGCGHLDRRTFLKVSSAAATLGVIGGGLFGGLVYADALTREQRDKMTPDQILAEMKRGNERFRKGERETRSYLNEQKASAKGQYPAAVVLSCIDSRAPAEVIMDLGIGDIFNARVAGNIANADILGSMEFACKLAGAKVVLVMGHTACGAIKGAIDNANLGNLTGLLAKIKPAVKATSFKGEQSSKNAAFVDAVAQKNVELTMADIRKKSPVLAELESKGAIKIAGSMYNLERATVDFFV